MIHQSSVIDPKAKISKNVKIPYGEAIPNNVGNEKIKSWVKRGLITTTEGKTANNFSIKGFLTCQ